MRDYRSYENRRRAAGRRRDRGAPRALLIGLGVFACAIVVVGAVLILGGGDDPPATASELTNATATRTVAIIPPMSSSTPEQSAQAASTLQPTATGETQAPETGESADATATPEPAPELPEETATPEDGGPEDEPTEEPVVEGEPTVAPPAGDFGTLPPADVPSGGLGRDLVLEFDLAIGEADLPAEATVYHMLWAAHTSESVSALAASLGVSGDVTGSDGNFRVDGEDGTLAISGQSVQYLYGGKVPPVELEDDATLIAAASDWLLSNRLVLDDLGPGAVIGRDELGARVSVVFYATDPDTLLSVYPSARLTLGPGATILEAYVIWPSGYESSIYGLRSLDDLMGDLYDGRAFVEADLSGVPGNGQVLGSMTITSVALAYSTAGSSAVGQFLTPVVVFSGEAFLSESGQSIPVSLYVPAVFAQDAPRG